MTGQRHILCGLGLLLALLAPRTAAGSPATAAGADRADTAYGRALALAAAHQGYVVQGKAASVRVLRAMAAYERCLAVTAARRASGCGAALQTVEQAEDGLLHRGRAVLTAGEPAARGPVYATAPVVVTQEGDTSAVISFLPSTMAAPAPSLNQGGAHSGSAPASPRPARLAAARPGSPAQALSGCGARWCYAHVSLRYTPRREAGTLLFSYDLYLSRGCPASPHHAIEGTAWHVGGRASPGQRWSNFRYTNLASTMHEKAWMRVYGSLTSFAASDATPLWTKVVTLDVSIDCVVSRWTWRGATIGS